MTSPTEALADFEMSHFTAGGSTRVVYRLGAGPAVLVLSEIPGITPLVAAFARQVAARGHRVVLPHLFGRDGHSPNNSEDRKTIQEVCISREFTLFATKKSSRITKWLNELAQYEHEANGGPGVGVVGMCLTGGFALAMMVDPVVVAPVLSQPSLPIGLLRRQRARAAVGLSDDELERVKQRVAAGTCVLALRFTGDSLVPAERFATLRRELGDGFIGVEIDSSANNPWGYPPAAHSVLTEHLGPEGDTPTRRALEQVLDFFDERLASPGA
ncbi:MAG: dienelactone hydrolase family protein [Actinomycetota bacterium]